MITGIEAKAVEGAVGLAGDLVTFFLGETKEGRARRRDERTLTHALGIEIAELVIALARRHDWWTTRLVEPEKWLPPLVPFYTEAFDPLRGRIDALPPDLVAPVVRFYGYVRFVNGQAATLADYSAANRLNEFRLTFAASLLTLIGIGDDTMRAFATHLKIGKHGAPGGKASQGEASPKATKATRAR